jgi:hypothetical protein
MTIFFATAMVLANDAEKKYSHIDLQPQANVKLADDFHANNPGNNLAELAKGEQTLKEVKFKVGEKCLQVGSSILSQNNRDFPKKFEGIKVDRLVAKLHILHALGYGNVFEAKPESLPKDKVIAKYVIHYEDNTKEEIQVVYGEDICDWWFAAGSEQHSREPTRAKVGWEGKNEVLKDTPAVIRLYLMTWKNPKPEKKVLNIDFLTTCYDEGPAPFCVAMTVEGK